MALSQEELDFINSPDSVDFVLRTSEFFLGYAQNVPELVIAKTLSGGYLVCYLHRDNIEQLRRVLGPGFINAQSVVLGPLEHAPLDAAGITQVHNQPFLSLKGNGVLVGIVDTGIDYTQPPFIYDDGTSKIRFLYDMTGQNNAPEDFAIGTEYTNDQINEALRSGNPFEIVPEQDTSGHGTFIASIAAGREVGDFIGAAPESEIIAVKLRKAQPYYLERFLVPEGQENAFSSSSIMVGVEYIITKARELGRPVAICIGLGTNFGSHDGYSVFEEYLSGIASQKGVCLCTAVGNESQARHHTQGTIAATGETQNIDIKVGENPASFLLSLWNSVADRLSVSVRSPTGELVGRVPAKSGTEATVSLVLENASVTIRYYFPLETSGGQLTVIQLLNATPGLWTLIVHGDIILDGTYHCWLPLTGFVSDTVEFLSAIPYYTVTVPSTMYGSITCGAYNSFQNSLYLNTSWGPTRSPAMSPDLVAPGVDIGGYSTDGYGLMSGTSAAAAITTGACALLLQWGIVEGNDVAISTYQIRAYLIRGCSRSTAMTYPNYQWGYGKLDIMQSFNLMREL